MEYVTYKTFDDQEQAKAFAQFLNDNQIESEITNNRIGMDPVYGASYFRQQFFVKIKPEDFPRVDNLLSRESEKELDHVDKDHYLFQYTNEELFDILAKPDEWSVLDFQLAKKILKDRDVDVTDEKIVQLKSQRLRELAKPEDSSNVWIYAGYLLALFGGLLGIFLATILITTKKTLPNGQRVYTYSVGHRKHGYWILIIGIVMFVVIMVIRFQRELLEL